MDGCLARKAPSLLVHRAGTACAIQCLAEHQAQVGLTGNEHVY